MNEAVRNMMLGAGVLAGFAVVGSTLLAVTERATRSTIAEQQQQALRSTVSAVLPADSYTNDLLADTLVIRDRESLGTDEPLTAYRARRDGEPVAVVFPVVAPNGYSGAIRLLVGIGVDGELTGVRVLQHRETPGLGDAIETRRSDWIRQFAGLSFDDIPPSQWKVRKDGGVFDQFTGATITPRAVVEAIRKAMRYFEDHRTELLTPPPTDTSS